MPYRKGMPSADAKEVPIGKDYRPWRYENRSPIEYQSLRPHFSDSELRVQSALLRLPHSSDRFGIAFRRAYRVAGLILLIVALLGSAL